MQDYQLLLWKHEPGWWWGGATKLMNDGSTTITITPIIDNTKQWMDRWRWDFHLYLSSTTKYYYYYYYYH